MVRMPVPDMVDGNCFSTRRDESDVAFHVRDCFCSSGVKVAAKLPKRLKGLYHFRACIKRYDSGRVLWLHWRSHVLGNDDFSRLKLGIGLHRENFSWNWHWHSEVRASFEVDGVTPGKLSSSSTLVPPVR